MTTSPSGPPTGDDAPPIAPPRPARTPGAQPPAGAEDAAPPAPAARGVAARIGFLALGAACFAYLYFRLHGAAARAGLSLADYMAGVFANVEWTSWIALMIAYSGLYFCIDTLVVGRALAWFVSPVRYRDLLPIRASAYVVSLVNEQVGKGAMAWYLNRRHRVPGWEVGSVMLFVMFCEVFYLLFWATVGFAFSGGALPPAFGLVPWFAGAAALVFGAWVLYFRGALWPGHRLRDKRIFHAFRLAGLRHYALFVALRSPALLAAVVVYTVALRLFGVEAHFLSLLGYLPVIFFAAAVPTPMRAAAITFWVILFPENEGQMAAFGFVQHNFFILFNALIGAAFWPRAQRELFG